MLSRECGTVRLLLPSESDVDLSIALVLALSLQASTLECISGHEEANHCGY
jgi:hypothetical protein